MWLILLTGGIHPDENIKYALQWLWGLLIFKLFFEVYLVFLSLLQICWLLFSMLSYPSRTFIIVYFQSKQT